MATARRARAPARHAIHHVGTRAQQVYVTYRRYRCSFAAMRVRYLVDVRYMSARRSQRARPAVYAPRPGRAVC